MSVEILRKSGSAKVVRSIGAPMVRVGERDAAAFQARSEPASKRQADARGVCANLFRNWLPRVTVSAITLSAR